MKTLNIVLALIVLGIGVYMTVSYWNAALPPTLSGIAFIAIAIHNLLKKA